MTLAETVFSVASESNENNNMYEISKSGHGVNFPKKSRKQMWSITERMRFFFYLHIELSSKNADFPRLICQQGTKDLQVHALTAFMLKALTSLWPEF